MQWTPGLSSFHVHKLLQSLLRIFLWTVQAIPGDAPAGIEWLNGLMDAVDMMMWLT
jgi:hypothetical protein